MRDVIQKIVATEAEAKQQVQAARGGAGRIIMDARKQAQELLATARQTVRLEAEKLLASAAQAAEAEKQTRLARSAAEIETAVSIDETTVRQVAEATVRCVCGFH